MIRAFGAYDATRSALDPATPVTRYGDDSLIAPGFVDLHVHYPQTQMIGAYGKQLLEWLEAYTFVAEQHFADARARAQRRRRCSSANACAPARRPRWSTAPSIPNPSTRSSRRPQRSARA